MENTKKSNKLIKSKKYQGIYSKDTSNNDKMYYIAYKNANGNYSRYKVGLKSSGITEIYCYNLRNEEINKVRLNDNPKLSTKTVVIKFHEIALDYFYYQELAQKSDWKNSRNKYLNHIKPTLGHLNINDITSNMIHELKIKKLKTHANATVAMLVSFISSIYNYATKITKKFKGDNPAFGIERTIEINNARERYLTLNEIGLLLKRLENYENKIAPLLIIFVKFCLSLGARVTSILNITRRDININTRCVQIYDFKNKSLYNGYLNTKLFPDLKFLDSFKNCDYIFYYKDRVLQHRLVQYHMRPIYTELFNSDLEQNDYKNRVVNHTLRHTFASHLAINGVSVFEIQKLLNHRDINMTMRYMKLAEENKISAVEGIY